MRTPVLVRHRVENAPGSFFLRARLLGFGEGGACVAVRAERLAAFHFLRADRTSAFHPCLPYTRDGRSAQSGPAANDPLQTLLGLEASSIEAA